MNYDNREEAFEICEQITKLIELEEELRGSGVEVQINRRGNRIQTIVTDADSEHDFAHQARVFIYSVVEDVIKRRVKLTEKLEKL